jgi:carbon-monoxide dehydrogenase medium subunit
LKAARFDYARALTAAQACRLLQDGGGMAKVLGGGQSLGPMMNLRLVQPDLLVDVRNVADLHRCSATADAVTLGAATTHAAIEDGKFEDPTQGLMPHVAAGIAYRAIRNRGTLGGSLAHADPAADWVNLMPLLDAEILLQGPSGTRTVRAAEWMLGAFTTVLRDDELVGAVRIARLSAGAHWTYYKVHRKAGEFADALAGFISDPGRAVCRGLVGATDGCPHVFAAEPLLDGWDVAYADAQLRAAGLKPDTYEYRIHAVALQRAAAQLRHKGRVAA